MAPLAPLATPRCVCVSLVLYSVRVYNGESAMIACVKYLHASVQTNKRFEAMRGDIVLCFGKHLRMAL